MNSLRFTVIIAPELLEAAASARRDLFADHSAHQAAQGKLDAEQAALESDQKERRSISAQGHEPSKMRAAIDRASELDGLIAKAKRELNLLQIEANGAAVALAASCRRAFLRLGEIYLSDFEQRHEAVVDLLLPFFRSRREAEIGVSQLDFFRMTLPAIRNRINVRISADEHFVLAQLEELDRVLSGQMSTPWKGAAPFEKSFAANDSTEPETQTTVETTELQPA